MHKDYTGTTGTRPEWMAGFILFVVTMALYWPVTTFPFVNYDDPLYVSENPDVRSGLSWHGIKYAFTTIVAANWHPVTVLSHMLDCSLFSQFAGGHHLIDILLHSTNGVLLFCLLRRLTHGFGPSILGAALFAWHPLNVESVAWIAERKNVLSTGFFLLTLLAYLSYTKNFRPANYLLALVLFALGLLAKPMLVTLPFLLLLLDYWPLRRIGFEPDSPPPRPSVKRVLWEKVPFLMLAVADCVITYLAQSRAGAVVPLAASSVACRMLNIPIAYLMYLQKTFWPDHLGILYSFPEKWLGVRAIVASVLLLTGTAAAWHYRWKFRWLAVGWLWFLGTLVPVIGVVQIGGQAWADRYAYVPLIGIFLIIGCGLNGLWLARQSLRTFIGLGVSVFLVACLLLTRQQITHWRNSVALFSQAILVNPNNAAAQNHLGIALNGAGLFTEAAEHFRLAAHLQPQIVEYQYNLARALIDAGRFAEATVPLATVLKQKPDNFILHNTLGVAIFLSGQPHEAEREFYHAITLQPGYAKSYFNLGRALLAEGQPKPAITNFLTALHLEPDWPEAMERLAAAYDAAGDSSNAIATASLALAMAQADRQMKLTEKVAAECKVYQTKASGP